MCIKIVDLSKIYI